MSSGDNYTTKTLQGIHEADIYLVFISVNSLNLYGLMQKLTLLSGKNRRETTCNNSCFTGICRNLAMMEY